MNSNKYDAFGATDKGLVREKNEDLFLIDLDHHLFAVADGLGGLPAGETASKLAIDSLASFSNQVPIDFQNVFDRINKIVNQIGNTINTDFGIGTTLTAIQFHKNKLYAAHVGDSGLFHFTKNQWFQLTKDHTMAEEIKNNADPKNKGPIPEYYNHVLTQCLGKNDNLKPQIFEHILVPNDRFLLYSDGVTKAFSPDELHLLAYHSTTAEQFVKTIIKEANLRGGLDNVTAIAIFV